MTRHFGIPNVTRREIASLPDPVQPPAGSNSGRVLYGPFSSPEDQDFAARIVGSAILASPFVIFGICFLVVRVFA